MVLIVQYLVTLDNWKRGLYQACDFTCSVKIQALALSMLCVKEIRLNSSFYDWENIFLMPGLALPAVYVSGHG